VLHQIDLISGPVPFLLGSLALALVALSFGRLPRWTVVTGVLAGSVLVVAAARLLLPGSVDVARIPPSFYVWAGLPLIAIGLVSHAWPTASRSRRVAALSAIPLAVAFSANQVNAWFAYLPTAADLVRAPLRQEIPLARLGTSAHDGAVVRLDIPGDASAFRHRRALVWLPPAAQRTPRTPLPVVMMLAGTPGRPDDLLRAAGLAAVASRYAAAHDGVAPILVFPDHNGSFTGDTECVDGPRGAAETYLTVDVPRFVTTTFGARAGWGIFGYSEGGTCALTLSLRHPELFSGFVDIAGDLRSNLGSGPRRDEAAVRDLFGGDRAAWAANDPRALLGARRFDGLGGWFVAGTSDQPARRSATTLLSAARAAGVDARYVTTHGHHSFRMVAGVTPTAFDWLAGRLAAPPAIPEARPR
jgi:S-formylglutathione hydrolase FrmB